MDSIRYDLTHDGKLNLEVGEQMELSKGEDIYMQVIQDEVGSYG